MSAKEWLIEYLLLIVGLTGDSMSDTMIWVLSIAVVLRVGFELLMWRERRRQRIEDVRRRLHGDNKITWTGYGW